MLTLIISGSRPATLISTDASIENPSVFALEKHLEDFLVQNWHHTDLGKHYDIFEEEGEIDSKLLDNVLLGIRCSTN
jgi:restriction system protein